MTVVVALNNTQRASLVLSHQELTEWNHLSSNCKINTRTNILQNNSQSIDHFIFFSVCGLLQASYICEKQSKES